ncbi:MAG: glycosyltransferase family 2 protein [Ruminococcaceae bacterium]|nr:glycosyltransferase family 2 protein [Oscillospiraceae bacterium]
MKLYLVIPCYNEQEVLGETAKRTAEKLRELAAVGKISSQSRICFVDDGSKDDTWKIIEELCSADEIYSGVKLSRNKGHQNALLAGLMSVKDECDAAISLDADLQDDIGAIDKMVDKYTEGCDVVYGVRSSRKTDKMFKRTTARCFYKMMRTMGVELVYDHADYRLMSKRALEALSEFDEVNLFLRGLVPLIGFKSDVVEYERNKRFAGKSKYPLKKMISFAFEGVTSMSIKPIRMISVLGFFIFLTSIGMLLYSLIRHFTGNTVEGWTSIVVSVWAIGGLQLLAIGVIGEYIGKIYLETKRRPKYVVDKLINLDKSGDKR